MSTNDQSSRSIDNKDVHSESNGDELNEVDDDDTPLSQINKTPRNSGKSLCTHINIESAKEFGQVCIRNDNCHSKITTT